ncbi:MAG: hypothetical protein HC814_06185, partial [Rhodobacteraceae bacterium]|nr:hypothetical protein [Paracoccaceae bacterium]
MTTRMTIVLTVLFSSALLAAQDALATVAYQVPAGTVGTQNYPFPLGMDFDVVNPITITDLGVFDSGSNGLSLALSASLWNRNSTGAPLVTLAFPVGPTGTLIDGSRFLPLGSPLTLPAVSAAPS